MGTIDPAVLLDLGFQLSFAATAGLILLGAHLTPAWRGLPRGLASGFGLTLAAQIMTLPIVVHDFHSISIAAPLANVLIGPALPLLMGSAIVPVLLGAVPGAGPLLATPSWLLSRYVLAVVGWVAQLPGATITTGSLPLWAVFAAYILMLLPLALAHGVGPKRSSGGRWPVGIALAGGVIGLILVGQLASLRSGPSGQLRAVFFDSAAAGLSLIETPSGRRLLLGSAGSVLAANALAERLPLFDRTVDLVVVTRAGERDLDGLAAIVNRFPIGLVLQPEAGRGVAWSTWTAALGQRGIPVINASQGLALELEDARLEVDSVANDDERLPALTLRLQFGSLDLLIAGHSWQGTPDEERRTVVRLAPELSPARAWSGLLAEGADRLAIVGGRRASSGSGSPAHFSLAGGDVVELRSDGVQTRVWRAPCQPDMETCSWPPEAS